MMTFEVFKSIKSKVGKLDALQNTYELVENRDQHIKTFQEYFTIYKNAQDTGNFESLKELEKKAKDGDTERLHSWQSIAQGVEELEEKGLITIEPSKIHMLTAEGAFAIISTAWDNLMQFQEYQEHEPEQERSR